MSKNTFFILLVISLILSACASPAAPSMSVSSGGPSSSVGVAPAVARSASGETSAESSSSGEAKVSATASPPQTTQSGVLTAGDIDDNLNFAAFQNYLNNMLQADTNQTLPNVALSSRVTLKVVDATGAGVANAQVSLSTSEPNASQFEGVAGAEGVFYFFPQYDGFGEAQQFTAQVRAPDSLEPETRVTFNLAELNETRQLEVRLNTTTPRPTALDVLFIIDTTGSMGDEIAYLKAEFRDIVATVQAQFPEVSMRFGLVVYRDQGDEYVVRNFDFTDSVEAMQQALDQQSANGGGDYPEAMEQALARGLEASWRAGNTTRLAFLVADAPPHDNQVRALLTQAQTARRLGVRLYPLAASGVADTAEYLMRIMATTTHSRYLFLTDDSGVGNSHAEPKVPCYDVTRLDHLLIRVIASELAGQRIEATDAQILRRVGGHQGGVCG